MSKITNDKTIQNLLTTNVNRSKVTCHVHAVTFVSTANIIDETAETNVIEFSTKQSSVDIKSMRHQVYVVSSS